jgi:autotransporter-associated beta strand protein
MDLQWDPTGGSNFVDIPNTAFSEPANNLIKAGTGTLTLSNTDTYSGQTVVNSGRLVVNGKLLDTAAVTINGGTLSGDGKVPATTVQSGGVLSPGNSPGTLTVGSVSFATGSTFNEELGGIIAGKQYAQMVIPAGGTVTLDNPNLNISFLGGFLPTVGQQFIVINNQGGSSVVGTFIQGSTYTVDGYTFGINYAGGVGQDVVLTVLSQPGATRSAITTVGVPTTSSQLGHSVTFTATAISATPASGTPMGTVIFEVGSFTLGTVSLGHGGARSVSTTASVDLIREPWGGPIVVSDYRSNLVVTTPRGNSLPGPRATKQTAELTTRWFARRPIATRDYYRIPTRSPIA